MPNNHLHINIAVDGRITADSETFRMSSKFPNLIDSRATSITVDIYIRDLDIDDNVRSTYKWDSFERLFAEIKYSDREFRDRLIDAINTAVCHLYDLEYYNAVLRANGLPEITNTYKPIFLPTNKKRRKRVKSIPQNAPLSKYRAKVFNDICYHTSNSGSLKYRVGQGIVVSKVNGGKRTIKLDLLNYYINSSYLEVDRRNGVLRIPDNSPHYTSQKSARKKGLTYADLRDINGFTYADLRDIAVEWPIHRIGVPTEIREARAVPTFVYDPPQTNQN